MHNTIRAGMFKVHRLNKFTLRITAPNVLALCVVAIRDITLYYVGVTPFLHKVCSTYKATTKNRVALITKHEDIVNPRSVSMCCKICTCRACGNDHYINHSKTIKIPIVALKKYVASTLTT